MVSKNGESLVSNRSLSRGFPTTSNFFQRVTSWREDGDNDGDDGEDDDCGGVQKQQGVPPH